MCKQNLNSFQYHLKKYAYLLLLTIQKYLFSIIQQSGRINPSPSNIHPEINSLNPENSANCTPSCTEICWFCTHPIANSKFQFIFTCALVVVVAAASGKLQKLHRSNWINNLATVAFADPISFPFSFFCCSTINHSGVVHKNAVKWKFSAQNIANFHRTLCCFERCGLDWI